MLVGDVMSMTPEDVMITLCQWTGMIVTLQHTPTAVLEGEVSVMHPTAVNLR